MLGGVDGTRGVSLLGKRISSFTGAFHKYFVYMQLNCSDPEVFHD